MNEICSGGIGEPDAIAGEIERGWIFVSVPESRREHLESISMAITEAFADPEPVYDEEGQEVPPRLAIRADVTDGACDMVVPISARPEEFNDLYQAIDEIVGEIEGATTQLARVVRYNPFPSTCSAAYVAEAEAFNPTKGLKRYGTGVNGWG